MYYRLDENKNAIPCTLEEWCDYPEGRKSKRVAQDTINNKWISTVFLGLDHQWEDDGPPLIFETMIHDKEKNEWLDYEERYSTWKEAEVGHQKAIEWVKNGCKEE